MVVALTKKQQWKENDEWVVVGLKESKSVERGWIVVPDKNKKPSRDRGVPERVDKVLARCDPYEELERTTSSAHARPRHPRAGTACASARGQILHPPRPRHLRGRGRHPTRTEGGREVRPIHPSTEKTA